MCDCANTNADNAHQPKLTFGADCCGSSRLFFSVGGRRTRGGHIFILLCFSRYRPTCQCAYLQERVNVCVCVCAKFWCFGVCVLCEFTTLRKKRKTTNTTAKKKKRKKYAFSARTLPSKHETRRERERHIHKHTDNQKKITAQFLADQSICVCAARGLVLGTRGTGWVGRGNQVAKGGIWRGKGLRKETSENINEQNSRPEGKLNNCISETGHQKEDAK